MQLDSDEEEEEGGEGEGEGGGEGLDVTHVQDDFKISRKDKEEERMESSTAAEGKRDP